MFYETSDAGEKQEKCITTKHESYHLNHCYTIIVFTLKTAFLLQNFIGLITDLILGEISSLIRGGLVSGQQD